MEATCWPLAPRLPLGWSRAFAQRCMGLRFGGPRRQIPSSSPLASSYLALGRAQAAVAGTSRHATPPRRATENTYGSPST